MLTKKRISGFMSVLLAIALVASFGACLPVSAEESKPVQSVLYNGAAESSTAGYRQWVSNEAIGAISVDNTVTHNGMSSLKMANSGTENIVTDLNIETVTADVAEGEKIRVSGFFKADALTNNIYVRLCGTGGYQPELSVPSGTYDWTYYEQTITLTQELVLNAADYGSWTNIGNSILIGCQWHTGNFWMQGVRIEIINSDPNVIYDGSAERSSSGCRPYISNDSIGTISTDPTVSHSNLPSLKFASTGVDNIITDYNIESVTANIPAGASIRISGFFKADALTNSIYFRLCGTNGNQPELTVPSGTYDWTYYEKIVTLNADLVLNAADYGSWTNIGNGILIGSQWHTGSFWVQGARVEIVKTDPAVIYNGAAEKNINGYRSWASNDSISSIKLDNTVTYNDQPSMKFGSTGTGSDNVITDFNIENIAAKIPAGYQVRISGYFKAENLTNSIYVRLCGTNGYQPELTVPSGNFDWTYHETVVTATKTLELLAADYGTWTNIGNGILIGSQWHTGSFWVQGVKVEIVSTGVDGDVDSSGAADAADLIAVRHELIGVSDVDRIALLAYDMNDDGEVNILDLVRIKKLIAQNI